MFLIPVLWSSVKVAVTIEVGDRVQTSFWSLHAFRERWCPHRQHSGEESWMGCGGRGLNLVCVTTASGPRELIHSSACGRRGP